MKLSASIITTSEANRKSLPPTPSLDKFFTAKTTFFPKKVCN